MAALGGQDGLDGPLLLCSQDILHFHCLYNGELLACTMTMITVVMVVVLVVMVVVLVVEVGT